MKMETANKHQHQFRTHRKIATCNIGHWVQHQCGAVEVETRGPQYMAMHKA